MGAQAGDRGLEGSPGRREPQALGGVLATGGQIRVPRKAACLPMRIAQDEDGEHRAGGGRGSLPAANPCYSHYQSIVNWDFRKGCPSLFILLRLRGGTRGWCILEMRARAWDT